MKKRKKYWIIGSVIWLLVLLTVTLMIFLDIPYIGLDKLTYQPTALRLQEEDFTEDGFVLGGVSYQRLPFKAEPRTVENQLEPVISVPYQTIHLLRRYGYNFYQLPNEQDLTVVVCGLQYDLYCPAEQVEQAKAYYNDPARHALHLHGGTGVGPALPSALGEALVQTYHASFGQGTARSGTDFRRYKMFQMSDGVVTLEYQLDLVQLDGTLYFAEDYTYMDDRVEVIGTPVPADLSRQLAPYLK